MENTNLSKETVLSVLQNLVKKGLIVKKDVKSYKTFNLDKKAQGAQHFCLYYTTISRKEKNRGSRNLTRNDSDSQVKNLDPYESENMLFNKQDCEYNNTFENKNDNFIPVDKENKLKNEENENHENRGSRNLTRKDSRVKNLDPYGSRNLTGAGQEFRPNNKFDNKDDTSTSSDPEKTNKAAEEESLQNKIHKKLNELFGYPVSFSPSPIPKLINAAEELNMTEQELLEYLEWVYSHLKKKCNEPENFDGYFYKSFSESHLMARFKNTQEKKKLEAEQKASQIIVCPVCGNSHNRNDLFCSVCGLECDSIENPDEIQKKQRILKMDEEERNRYEEALQKAENEYPVTTRFHDKEAQENYEFRVLQIEAQFGLYKPETIN